MHAYQAEMVLSLYLLLEIFKVELPGMNLEFTAYRSCVLPVSQMDLVNLQKGDFRPMGKEQLFVTLESKSDIKCVQ